MEMRIPQRGRPSALAPAAAANTARLGLLLLPLAGVHAGSRDGAVECDTDPDLEHLFYECDSDPDAVIDNTAGNVDLANSAPASIDAARTGHGCDTSVLDTPGLIFEEGECDGPTQPLQSGVHAADRTPSVKGSSVLEAVENNLQQMAKASPIEPDAGPYELPAPPTKTAGVNFHSVEEMMQLGNPHIIKGMYPELHRRAMTAWSPAALRDTAESGQDDVKDPKYQRFIRSNRAKVAVRGGNWIRYHEGWKASYTRDPGENYSYFLDKSYGMKWPAATGDYDDYDERAMTMAAVLDSPVPAKMVFDIADLPSSVHAARRDALKALQKEICGLGFKSSCLQSVLWLSSAGARSSFHYDRLPNLYLQLVGVNTFVLSPPAATLKTAHISPKLGPLSRNSQVAFSPEGGGRAIPAQYSIPAGNDTNRPPHTYDGSNELRVVLTPGMALYLPGFWGHRTYPTAPSVSLGNWLHLPGTSDEPDQVYPPRLYFDVRGAISRDIPTGPKFAGKYWRRFRALGTALASILHSPQLLSNWYEQRWRPLLGGLKTSCDARLPELFCLPFTGMSLIEQQLVQEQAQIVAGKIAPSVSADVPRDRDVILEHFVGDFLDEVAGMNFIGLRQAGTVGDADTLLSAPTEDKHRRLANAVRSFVHCSDSERQ